MKKISIVLVILVICGCSNAYIKAIDNDVLGNESIIVDHTCIDIAQIPKHWIEYAKSNFAISYGHTSHGSQIISGMSNLMEKDDFYSFSNFPGKKHLTIYDGELKGDLGNPDRETWYHRTKDLLDHGWGDTNIVLWSWCGQVSNASQEEIELYLGLMDSLEKQYPGIVFIYMTGHLNGTGEGGNLNLRNNQIREFCRKNNKVLYDFADIESYDPDGRNYVSFNADDRCDYIENGIKKNWAQDWCDFNMGECSSYQCAHSMPLNCDLKARAFWWLMARLAGWRPDLS